MHVYYTLLSSSSVNTSDVLISIPPRLCELSEVKEHVTVRP